MCSPAYIPCSLLIYWENHPALALKREEQWTGDKICVTLVQPSNDCLHQSAPGYLQQILPLIPFWSLNLQATGTISLQWPKTSHVSNLWLLLTTCCLTQLVQECVTIDTTPQCQRPVVWLGGSWGLPWGTPTKVLAGGEISYLWVNFAAFTCPCSLQCYYFAFPQISVTAVSPCASSLLPPTESQRSQYLSWVLKISRLKVSW